MNLSGKTGRLAAELEDWAGSTYRLGSHSNLTDAEAEMVNIAADVLKHVANMVFDRAIREHNRAVPEPFPE